VMRLVGRPDIAEKPWFASAGERVVRGELIDRAVAKWIHQRKFDEVVAAFQEAGAALAPIYDIEQLLEDPQIQARESVTTIQDEDLGPLKMQNLFFRMQRTPGAIRFGGRRLGQDNDEVYTELGLDARRLEQLREQGVV
jgi:crotonobetainyl-CoA:carnitine CoA-transferase CaiB-like acyl-CoA transferase